MITDFFIPELNNHDVQELWFQQDGATCHTARATIDLLKDTFGDRVISRLVTVNCPPRSCDLTPLDYFLWGYVKSLVYADKPQTLDHLEDNILRVIADIRPQTSVVFCDVFEYGDNSHFIGEYQARAKKVARFNETFPQAELRRLEQAESEAAHRAA
ncbi:uncharacterized protein TNCV_4019401 [Trichonephila clavipes]|nr:uncharacterized protein TNCV_4019401 [Trichonephila clavipes]